MLELDQFMNIHLLRKEGHSIRKIAHLSGHSRNTVRKVLKERAPRPPQKRACHSQLDEFKAYLRQRYQEHQLSAVRLTEEIGAMGFKGSVVIVRRFLHQLRQSNQISKKLTVRFESPPGKQAQCDWTEVGRYPLADGRRLYVHAFVMVLSYSRMRYLEFTTSMRQEVLIAAHQRAFDYFGGVPETILYDNMKQIRTGPGRLHPLFVDFATHYGFVIKCHRPWSPRTKGKVERSVGYVKDNFLRGRRFEGLEDLNSQRWAWLQNANSKVHATTGRVARDLLSEEGLQPLAGLRPWTPAQRCIRRVNAEALVQLQGTQYSVPARYCRHRVEVEARAGTITIRSGDLIIASHPETLEPRGARVELAEHVKQRWELSQANGLKKTMPAKPLCEIRLEPTVQERPLSVYEQEAAA
jgi:transposase